MEARFPRGTILNMGCPERDMTISCESGAIWLTQHGDARDYVLIPGRKFHVYREGRIVVQMLKESMVSIRPGNRCLRIHSPEGSRWERSFAKNGTASPMSL